MINILDALVEYLGTKLSLVPGENIFYNTMPDEASQCVLLAHDKHSVYVPVQIDASAHTLRVTVRNTTSDNAFALAGECYKWLLVDTGDYTSVDSEPTGFIELNNGLSVYVQLHGTPIWEKTDQQGRRYYYFTATLITKRL